VHVPELVPTTTRPPAAAAHVATAPTPGALLATSSSENNVRPPDGSSIPASVDAEGRDDDDDDEAPSSDTPRSFESEPSAPLAISVGPTLLPSSPRTCYVMSDVLVHSGVGNLVVLIWRVCKDFRTMKNLNFYLRR
jgi:hypothetical protein